MGRTRGFDEDAVLTAAAGAFVRGGYEATSVDDLVGAVGVHRGSLYNTFGSKRGLFLRTLERHIATTLAPLAATAGTTAELEAELVSGPALDLVLVAAIERGHEDAEVAAAVRTALDVLAQRLPADAATRLLGARLGARLIS